MLVVGGVAGAVGGFGLLDLDLETGLDAAILSACAPWPDMVPGSEVGSNLHVERIDERVRNHSASRTGDCIAPRREGSDLGLSCHFCDGCAALYTS